MKYLIVHLIALTDDIWQLHGRECVRRVGIIEPYYFSILIEEAQKNEIDEVGKKYEFDVFIQCEKNVLVEKV